MLQKTNLWSEKVDYKRLTKYENNKKVSNKRKRTKRTKKSGSWCTLFFRIFLRWIKIKKSLILAILLRLKTFHSILCILLFVFVLFCFSFFFCCCVFFFPCVIFIYFLELSLFSLCCYCLFCYFPNTVVYCCFVVYLLLLLLYRTI